MGTEDEDYSGPWPSCVTMGSQIMVDAIDRALETVVYSFRTNLCAPSGMLYFVVYEPCRGFGRAVPPDAGVSGQLDVHVVDNTSVLQSFS